MAYSPPKKITVILSFLLLLFGFFLILTPVFWMTDFYSIFPALTVGDLSSFEVYLIIALVLIFLSWLLFFIGINYRGI